MSRSGQLYTEIFYGIVHLLVKEKGKRATTLHIKETLASPPHNLPYEAIGQVLEEMEDQCFVSLKESTESSDFDIVTLDEDIELVS